MHPKTGGFLLYYPKFYSYDDDGQWFDTCHSDRIHFFLYFSQLHAPN